MICYLENYNYRFVQVGAGILVGTDQEKIVNEAEKLLSDREHYNLMANAPNPFGDGKASLRILDQIALG